MCCIVDILLLVLSVSVASQSVLSVVSVVGCIISGLLLCYLYTVFSGFVIWSVIDVWNLPLEEEY